MTIDYFGTLINAKIINLLDAFGVEAGLPSLYWSIGPIGDVIEVVGQPKSMAQIDNCAAWAALFSMTEYEFGDGLGHRAWHGSSGQWHLEIIAEVLRSQGGT